MECRFRWGAIQHAWVAAFVPVVFAPLAAVTGNTQLAPAAPAGVIQSPPSAAVRLPRLAPKPNCILSRVVFENGQPVPKFLVQAGGFSGEFDRFPKNQRKGPQQLTETGSAFGMAAGVRRRYAIRITHPATMTGISALVQLHYDNTNWPNIAWPIDNIGIGTDPSRSAPNHAQTTKGIVRDFVLRLSGIKLGYDPAKFTDHGTNAQPNTPNACYGGTIFFDCGTDSTPAAYGGGVSGMMASRGGVTKVYPNGSIVTVTLTPTGPRVDGLPAAAITRSCPVDVNFSRYGIPYAHYTAKAILTEPSGAVHKVQLADKQPLTLDTWRSTASVKWTPWQDREPISLTIRLSE